VGDWFRAIDSRSRRAALGRRTPIGLLISARWSRHPTRAALKLTLVAQLADARRAARGQELSLVYGRFGACAWHSTFVPGSNQRCDAKGWSSTLRRADGRCAIHRSRANYELRRRRRV